jgi:hypothetical protein
VPVWLFDTDGRLVLHMLPASAWPGRRSAEPPRIIQGLVASRLTEACPDDKNAA